MRLPRLEEGKVSSYAEMKEGTLYHPGGEGDSDSKFPVADFLFLQKNKDEESLVLIQVSRELGNRRLDLSSIQKLYKILKLPYDLPVKYVYSEHPRRDSQEAKILLNLSMERGGKKTTETEEVYQKRLADIAESERVYKTTLQTKWSFFIAEFPGSYKLPVKKNHSTMKSFN